VSYNKPSHDQGGLVRNSVVSGTLRVV